MSAWTAKLLDCVWIPGDGHLARYIVEAGGVRVSLQVPDSDEGRATVAKMVAALQMEEALKELRDLMEDVRTGDYKPDSFTCQPADAALEAAKRLKP